MEILFRGVVGSRAYGMDTEDSDTDIKGVCLGPVNQYLGLEEFEQWSNPNQDEVIFEIRKFIRLALKANPGILEMLWLTEYMEISPLGQRLIDIRQAFLSIRAHDAFSGYAVGQIKKCRAKLDGKENAGIKAKNPYKHAAHCMRLLRMGYELVTTGEMNVNRAGLDSDELKEIRSGSRSLETVLEEAEKLLIKIDNACDSSLLPKEPDRDRVQKVVKNILWDYLLAENMK